MQYQPWDLNWDYSPWVAGYLAVPFLVYMLTGLALLSLLPATRRRLRGLADWLIFGLAAGITFHCLFFCLANPLCGLPIRAWSAWGLSGLVLLTALGVRLWRSRTRPGEPWPRPEVNLRELLILLALTGMLVETFRERVENTLDDSRNPRMKRVLQDSDPYRHHPRTVGIVRTGQIYEWDYDLRGEVSGFQMQGCYVAAAITSLLAGNEFTGPDGRFGPWFIWKFGSIVMGALAGLTAFVLARVLFRSALAGLAAAALLWALPVHMIRTNMGFSEAWASPFIPCVMLGYLLLLREREPVAASEERLPPRLVGWLERLRGGWRRGLARLLSATYLAPAAATAPDVGAAPAADATSPFDTAAETAALAPPPRPASGPGTLGTAALGWAIGLGVLTVAAALRPGILGWLFFLVLALAAAAPWLTAVLERQSPRWGLIEAGLVFGAFFTMVAQGNLLVGEFLVFLFGPAFLLTGLYCFFRWVLDGRTAWLAQIWTTLRGVTLAAAIFALFFAVWYTWNLGVDLREAFSASDEPGRSSESDLNWTDLPGRYHKLNLLADWSEQKFKGQVNAWWVLLFLRGTYLPLALGGLLLFLLVYPGGNGRRGRRLELAERWRYRLDEKLLLLSAVVSYFIFLWAWYQRIQGFVFTPYAYRYYAMAGYGLTLAGAAVFLGLAWLPAGLLAARSRGWESTLATGPEPWGDRGLTAAAAVGVLLGLFWERLAGPVGRLLTDWPGWPALGLCLLLAGGGAGLLRLRRRRPDGRWRRLGEGLLLAGAAAALILLLGRLGASWADDASWLGGRLRDAPAPPHEFALNIPEGGLTILPSTQPAWRPSGRGLLLLGLFGGLIVWAGLRLREFLVRRGRPATGPGWLAPVAVGVLLALILRAGSPAGRWSPTPEDAEYEALDWIAEHAEPDALIFTHWFTADFARAYTGREVVLAGKLRPQVEYAFQESLVGLDEAEVTETIPAADGPGATGKPSAAEAGRIAWVQRGWRFEIPAVSAAGAPLPTGTPVTVVDLKRTGSSEDWRPRVAPRGTQAPVRRAPGPLWIPLVTTREEALEFARRFADGRSCYLLSSTWGPYLQPVQDPEHFVLCFTKPFKDEKSRPYTVSVYRVDPDGRGRLPTDDPVCRTGLIYRVPAGRHVTHVWKARLPIRQDWREFTVRARHAVGGPRGAFRLLVYADLDGRGQPQQLVARSPFRHVERPGAWSATRFQLPPDLAAARLRGLYVGFESSPGTCLYFDPTSTGVDESLEPIVFFAEFPAEKEGETSAAKDVVPVTRARGERATDLRIEFAAPDGSGSETELEPGEPSPSLPPLPSAELGPPLWPQDQDDDPGNDNQEDR